MSVFLGRRRNEKLLVWEPRRCTALKMSLYEENTGTALQLYPREFASHANCISQHHTSSRVYFTSQATQISVHCWKPALFRHFSPHALVFPSHTGKWCNVYAVIGAACQSESSWWRWGKMTQMRIWTTYGYHAWCFKHKTRVRHRQQAYNNDWRSAGW